MATRLIAPDLAHLGAYAEALERGWSADTMRPQAAQEELARIAADPAAFVASLDDPEARGAPITLPDGSQVPRLPGLRRWIWDDGFCGSIGLRWQAGTADLPPYVRGHIGYAVVPWRRGEGQATRALGLLLPLARALGLPHVEITTLADNAASQAVVTANGGREVGRFDDPLHQGAETVRFRILL
ncbi:MAG: GNAT family N-acetyltransferase [Caulobacterales bacterium 32-69-10]|nr:MAG: GNAT family N-acetyltransferase [Caulobacterales bacterium 32-69-10]